MSKGWISIPTEQTHYYDTSTKKWYEKDLKTNISPNKINNFIKTTKKLTYKEIVDEGDQAYKDIQAYKAQLIEAYEQKRLKSKALIREAKKFIQEQEKETN